MGLGSEASSLAHLMLATPVVGEAQKAGGKIIEIFLNFIKLLLLK